MGHDNYYKFKLSGPTETGSTKGQQILTVNRCHTGGTGNITLEDFMQFCTEKDVDPSRVLLNPSFIATVKPKKV